VKSGKDINEGFVYPVGRLWVMGWACGWIRSLGMIGRAVGVVVFSWRSSFHAVELLGIEHYGDVGFGEQVAADGI
jgi:hypothetical protein